MLCIRASTLKQGEKKGTKKGMKKNARHAPATNTHTTFALITPDSAAVGHDFVAWCYLVFIQYSLHQSSCNLTSFPTHGTPFVPASSPPSLQQVVKYAHVYYSQICILCTFHVVQQGTSRYTGTRSTVPAAKPQRRTTQKHHSQPGLAGTAHTERNTTRHTYNTITHCIPNKHDQKAHNTDPKKH